MSAWTSTRIGRLLEGDRHGRASGIERAFLQESLRRVPNFLQAGLGHLEHPDFIGRAKSVLHRAENAELLEALTFEIQHRVDHVFKHARPGDVPLFGDMANDDDRDHARFCPPDELRGRFTNLPDTAGGRLEIIDSRGLDRIDDQHAWIRLLRKRDDFVQIRLRDDQHMLTRDTETFSAEANLVGRFFTAGIEAGSAVVTKLGGGLKHERGLADAGIPAHEHNRAGNEAPTEHPIELANVRSHPLRLGGFDLGYALRLDRGDQVRPTLGLAGL
ncbi:MAG: hypothetical protein R2848_14580 [Thermomicrobiales bacterium]